MNFDEMSTKFDYSSSRKVNVKKNLGIFLKDKIITIKLH